MKSVKKPTLVAVAAGVLAAVILAGGYLALVGPKRTKAADLQSATDAAQAQLTVAIAQSHRPAANTDRVEIADLFRLNRAMPDRLDIAGVLLDLSRTAHRAGTSLQSVTPGVATPGLSGGYESIPVAVQFKGRYGQLTKLLADLRRLVTVRKGDLVADGRLFGVDSVQFAAADDGFPKISATLNLEAYVFSAAPGADTSTQTTTTDPAPASSDSVSAAGSGATG